MDFALCTYRAGKTTQPRLALSLRQRGDHHTLLFSDGSYVSTWSARVHPLNFLDALPIVDRIALLDESLSTFPVLVRLVTRAALGFFKIHPVFYVVSEAMSDTTWINARTQALHEWEAAGRPTRPPAGVGAPSV